MASLPKAAFLPVALVTAAVSIAGADRRVSSGDDGCTDRSRVVLGQGASYSATFSTPGTYAYLCGIHNSMTGTVVVEP